jgi:alpha-beta hydrolase superfamily lysophospholipase
MNIDMPTTDVWTLPATTSDPALHLRRQRTSGTPRGAALYVHGATFPSALSLFFRFDGRSWADALNVAGFDAWGFDFAGYGESQRYPAMRQPAQAAPAVGRVDAAERQLATALHAVRRLAGERLPVHLIAHSWGTLVALRCAPAFADALASLTLFGPVVQRDMRGDGSPDAASAPAWRTLTIWEQYRRFIADVPRGEPHVLLDRHIQAWAAAYLATDPASASREPPAVQVPAGPGVDIAALWSGEPLVDVSRVRTPTLLVRGAWDPVCDDRDAARLLRSMTGAPARDLVLAKGTHLMHLETGRTELHRVVNDFLLEHTP